MICKFCCDCHINRELERVKNQPEDMQRSFMQAVQDILDDCNARDSSSPVATMMINRIYYSMFGDSFDYSVNNKFNAIMMTARDDISRIIERSPDRLKTAIKFARCGNYIDFGAVKNVSEQKLTELVANADNDSLDEDVYQALKNDLERCSRLLYITDNCGEIVLDRLCIDEIAGEYPNISITVMTRGGAVLNDATEADAEFAGITGKYRVIGNGTNVPGTPLDLICSEAHDAVYSADVIIAKGQGNFETLIGSGLNVYYSFLCKCDHFVDTFNVSRYTGMFVRERKK